MHSRLIRYASGLWEHVQRLAPYVPPNLGRSVSSNPVAWHRDAGYKLKTRSEAQQRPVVTDVSAGPARAHAAILKGSVIGC